MNHFILCQKHHLPRNIITTVSLLATVRKAFLSETYCVMLQKKQNKPRIVFMDYLCKDLIILMILASFFTFIQIFVVSA